MILPIVVKIESPTGGDHVLPNLKKLRLEYGISQQKLADVLHVTQPAIYKYENLNIEPEIAILKQMAAYFDTSIDYLVGNTEMRRRIEPTDMYALNEQERMLIDGFRTLKQDERECIEMTVRTFQNHHSKG